MIMANFDFLSEPIRLDEGTVPVLCLEEQTLFRRIYGALLSGETEEEGIVFSKDYTPFKSRGNVCVVHDYFSITYSNAILKKLYEQIEAYCHNECPIETVALKTHLVKYMETIVSAFEFDFDFCSDVDLIALFKAMALSPITDQTAVLNTLVDYLHLLNTYVPPHCVVLLNPHVFFNAEELTLLYADMLNRHIPLLVVENACTFQKTPYERVILYDCDFCEIVEKGGGV